MKQFLTQAGDAMRFLSLWRTEEGGRPWRVGRAAGYGAGIGALAACLKTVGPLRASAGGIAVDDILANGPEIVVATLGFAVLCAGAAALRNYMLQRLV